MYNNDYMYAIERNDEYLAHYGIRGMKWGVRKAIARGDSARLGRQYAKAQKKLAKLEKRAANSGKYARRAALMGAGAGIAAGVAGVGPSKIIGRGTGLANRVLGGSAAQKLARLDKGQELINKLNGGVSARNVIGKGVAKSNQYLGGGKAAKIARLDAGKNAMNAIDTAGRKGAAKANQYLGGNAATKMGRLEAGRNLSKAQISYNNLARVGAGAIGLGLAAGAAKNAYRAATAKKKAEKFRAAMNESFKGTKYANGGNRQGKKRRRG